MQLIYYVHMNLRTFAQVFLFFFSVFIFLCLFFCVYFLCLFSVFLFCFSFLCLFFFSVFIFLFFVPCSLFYPYGTLPWSSKKEISQIISNYFLMARSMVHSHRKIFEILSGRWTGNRRRSRCVNKRERKTCSRGNNSGNHRVGEGETEKCGVCDSGRWREEI